MTNDDVTRYLDGLVPPRHAEMQAMEKHAAQTRFPIIGPAAGHYCYQLARMMGARQIFELGSGYGYSTAWFALAVRDNGGGMVHHVVWDQELSDRACIHLAAMGLKKYVTFHVGEAVQTLRAETQQFDIIFNDIDKEGYPASLAVIRDRLRTGGVSITDNALWHGKVLDTADRSAATEGVRELTRLLTKDGSWLTSIVPIRDGLLVAWKV